MELTGDLLWSVLLGLLVGFLFYVKRSQSYWQSINVKTPPHQFLFGHVLPQFLKKESLRDMLDGFYQMYKGSQEIVGLYSLTKPDALLLDLDLVKRILITDYEVFDSRGVYVNEKDDPISAHLFSIGGPKWRRLRNKLSPTFTSGKLKGMFPIMVQISENFAKSVEEVVKENPGGFNIKNVTSRFTTDVIGNCAFGLECNSLQDPDNQFRIMGDTFFRRSFMRSLGIIFKQAFPDLSCKLGLRMVPKSVSDFFTKTVEDTVKYRETSGVTRNDFMDLLLKISKAENPEDRLNLQEIVSQSFIFFVAGFSTMLFCLYELAKREDIHEKAREHINEKLKEHQGELTYEALMDMDYLDKVIQETLRKYPAVPVLSRLANRDYQVPNSHVVIKKGALVHIPTISIQMDPQIYPNPEDFDPQRFDKEAVGQRHLCAFLPFGQGPRICIGERFGMIQAKVGLVALLRSFRFSLSEKTEIPVKLHKFAFLIMPEDDIHLKVEKVDGQSSL